MNDPDLEREAYIIDQYKELKARLSRILEELQNICMMSNKELPVVLNSMLDEYEPVIVRKVENYDKDLPF